MVLIQNHNEERREHFRINDSLFIQYKVIDQETAEQLGQQLINIEHGETNQHQVQLLHLVEEAEEAEVAKGYYNLKNMMMTNKSNLVFLPTAYVS